MSKKIYTRSPRKIVVFISPFVVLPPAHGGAIRTHRLAKELAKEFDIILISDEADLYDNPEMQKCLPFSYVCLVRDRPWGYIGEETCRIARIQNHSHQKLKDEVCRVVDLYLPVALVVEHEELSDLINIKATWQPKFILDLHDVLLCPGNPLQEEADLFVTDLMNRFDGLVVSSSEDQKLLGDCSSHIVPNGYDMDLSKFYTSSKGNRSLLFMGPFRAAINWLGIQDFVQNVYPGILAAVPDVSLTILGGKGALKMAKTCESFAHPSISILEYVNDPIPLLQQCALTINPQAELRGSSVKVIESLAAGRVCVSTRVGARGRLDPGFISLITTEKVSDLAEPIIGLLRDEETRLALEVPDQKKLKSSSWESSGNEIRSYVKHIIASSGTG
jgi:glycosyltransferase involved in cell wall biosynthesis